MHRLFRFLVTGSLALITSASVSTGSSANRVTGIRHWSAPDHTRIVLDLADRPDYQVRVLTAPDRVVVDLPATDFGPDAGPFTIDDGLIHRVRINRLRGNQAQVVLDLVGPRPHGVFTLEPHADRPNRVVIDVLRSASGSAETAPPAPREIRPRDDGVTVIVIDPGHGGDDPGAVRDGLREKDVVLEMARALQRAIREARPDVQVHLTRDGDYYLPLRQRYRLAESRNADLFVSLHVNAARGRSAQGADVYFLTLGTATDTEARRVAELENAADLVGGAPPEAGGDLVSILADLQMKNTLARSSLLAESLLGALDEGRLMKTRSVHQARFVVLQSARVPSVLVEVGFISNKQDNKQLRDRKYRDRLAAAMTRGMLGYLRRVAAADPGTPPGQP